MQSGSAGANLGHGQRGGFSLLLAVIQALIIFPLHLALGDSVSLQILLVYILDFTQMAYYYLDGVVNRFQSKWQCNECEQRLKTRRRSLHIW